MRKAWTRVSAAVVLAALSCPAPAQTTVEFKSITIVVGSSAGGGYDTYARVLARHIGRHIPGQPSVTVQNMPGASSLKAVQYLDANVPKDGSVMAAFNPGLITESLLNADKIRFKFSDVAWVGSITRDLRACYAWAATGIKTWDDLKTYKRFNMGALAPGTSSFINAAVLKNMFGIAVHQVTGYAGSVEQRLAIERGELEGNCGSWSAMPQDWVAHDKFNTLVRFSPTHPPDMPASVPFIEDLASTAEQRNLLTVLDASAELGRPFIVAKAVPAERVSVLRNAFRATLEDSGFRKEAEAQSLPLDPVAGEEAAAVIERIYAAPPELARKVKEVIE